MKNSFAVQAAVFSLFLTLMPFGQAVQADEAVPTLYSGSPAVNYAEITEITVAGKSLYIMPGSVRTVLTTDAESLTVTVPDGEAFIIRTPGSPTVLLENDAGLETCNVLKTLENQMLIQGPRTAVIRPSAYYCDTANYDKDNTAFVILSKPTAGETLSVGQAYQLFWQSEGAGANVVRIRLSTDDGVTFDQTVVEGLANNGFYTWTVPPMYSTDAARLKIEGMDGSGYLKSASIGPVFRIAGETPPAVEPPPPAAKSWDFDPASVTATAATIDSDKGFTLSVSAPEPLCDAGFRIKTKSSSAVYYCGADGKRHAFPNERIHASWYGTEGNWGGVVEVSDTTLANIPLGSNVTYRPGERMVKIQTDPKVYAVGANGLLRWVPTEEAAVALYGADWNRMIDDVPDSFFVDYSIGEPITLK